MGFMQVENDIKTGDGLQKKYFHMYNLSRFHTVEFPFLIMIIETFSTFTP